MRFPLAAMLVMALVSAIAFAQRPARRAKGPTPPEVAIVQIKVQREPKVVAVEGSVRNNSTRVLRGLVLFFSFLEADGHTITRKKIQAGADVLEPGEEAEFLGQTPDPVRAVQIRVEAEDKDGRVLNVDKPGPYDIE
jgi:hypothetical protein